MNEDIFNAFFLLHKEHAEQVEKFGLYKKDLDDRLKNTWINCDLFQIDLYLQELGVNEDEYILASVNYNDLDKINDIDFIPKNYFDSFSYFNNNDKENRNKIYTKLNIL